jgi:LmbE family N-acetylglucosaminyl deacetylase
VFSSILAIGAHPDDIEFSCFGFLLKQQKTGSKINVYIVSPDSLTDNPITDKRIQESLESFSLIPNANVLIRNKNNINNEDYQSISDDIRHLVNVNKIDLVLVHYPNDTMQEHRLLHDIVMTALRRLPVSIFLYKSPSTSHNFIPNLISNIKDEYSIKFDALKKHKSQSNKEYMSEESIKIFNTGWNGKKIGIDIYEEFYIERLIK